MSDVSDRLRKTASRGISVWGDLMMEAAQEIETLTAVCVDLHVAIGCKWGDNVYLEIDALRAALAQPDPVEVRRGWEYMREKGLLHPKPEPWMGVSDNPQTCPNPCNFEGRPKPVQEPYTDDVTRIMREAGVTFHLGLPHKAVVEQMSRVVDLVYAEASIKAAQQFATAPPQRKPLTDEEMQKLMDEEALWKFARAIEKAHGIR